MTNTIFKVSSFTELYDKLKQLYTVEDITAMQLLHNTSYIDIELHQEQITKLIQRYKKIYYQKELIDIEFYSKKNRFYLKINYNVKENDKWLKTSAFTRDINTIGYNSYTDDIAKVEDYFLQGRNRFKASDDEDKKYHMLWDNTLIGAAPIKKVLKENLDILEKMKDKGILDD